MLSQLFYNEIYLDHFTISKYFTLIILTLTKFIFICFITSKIELYYMITIFAMIFLPNVMSSQNHPFAIQWILCLFLKSVSAQDSQESTCFRLRNHR